MFLYEVMVDNPNRVPQRWYLIQPTRRLWQTYGKVLIPLQDLAFYLLQSYRYESFVSIYGFLIATDCRQC